MVQWCVELPRPLPSQTKISRWNPAIAEFEFQIEVSMRGISNHHVCIKQSLMYMYYIGQTSSRFEEAKPKSMRNVHTYRPFPRVYRSYQISLPASHKGRLRLYICKVPAYYLATYDASNRFHRCFRLRKRVMRSSPTWPFPCTLHRQALA